jgi:hypothetical protein
MSMPKVIGLYSPIPRSGKSTVANYLCHHHGYVRVPFASTLKDMAAVLLRDLGVMDTDALLSDKKHLKVADLDGIDPALAPALGFTVRHLCQTLGTEWGRQCLHTDIWTTVWQAKTDRLVRAGVLVVVDDMRFPNEYEQIKAMGGETWRITRPSLVADESVVKHASEGSLDHSLFDCEIYNTEDLDRLYQITETLMQSTRPLTSLELAA